MSVRALSIRQPWAWLIVHGPKDVENRGWRTGVRGPIWIHASKTLMYAEWTAALWLLGRIPGGADVLARMPDPKHMERGGLVGKATIEDCVSESASPWFSGPHGMVLRDAEPIPFVKCRGQLGFFRPEV